MLSDKPCWPAPELMEAATSIPAARAEEGARATGTGGFVHGPDGDLYGVGFIPALMGREGRKAARGLQNGLASAQFAREAASQVAAEAARFG